MCSCHSILECCVMLSGVKLSMGSFLLFFIPFMLSNIPSAPAYGVYAFMHPSSFAMPIAAQIMVTFYQASSYKIY